jgi:ABC-type cobalamin/Fe3+-siderophores transport system ATPase subunit
MARALCAEPDVIILDEPTNDMDIAGEESVLSLIRDVHGQTGAAMIIISHLLHVVLRMARDIVFINEAKIGVFTKDEFIADNHLERFYGLPIRIAAHPDGTYSVVAGESVCQEGEGG